MAYTNTASYVTRFERDIEQQYKREALSDALTRNKKFKFIDAQTIKVGNITVSGYKNHARTGGVNEGAVANDWIALRLLHDRSISFYVDEMDVDETNQALSAANITSVFNSEQAIPETDAYRFSELYQKFVTLNKTPDPEILTTSNVLEKFDELMEAMDEAEVPTDGRILYVTPPVNTMLKNASAVQRVIDVSKPNAINRAVRSLDEVEVVQVPSSRMLSKYKYDGATGGFTADAAAIQQHMILVHPSAVVAPLKVADVYLWPKGTSPETAHGWLYKNRSFQDLFIIGPKVDGVAICAYPIDAKVAGALTVTLGQGSVAGVKSTEISPAKAAGQSYLYKINGSIPHEDAIVKDGEDGWHAYTAGADIIAQLGDKLVFATVVDATHKVVKAGKIIVTAAHLGQ